MSKLWGVYFESMDEVEASASEEDAHKHADLLNAYFKKRQAESKHYPTGRALVMEWPSTAEMHAQCLKELQEDK